MGISIPRGMDVCLMAIITLVLYKVYYNRLLTEDTNAKGKNSNGKGKKKTKLSLYRIGSLVFVSVILSNLVILVWIVSELDAAGKGKIGGATAVAETIKTRFPVLFGFFTHIFLLPVPNLMAGRYYQQQKPLFEAAAREFKLHPYFTHTAFTGVDMRYHEIVHERIKAMAKMQTEDGRDDFKIEKDKCYMARFFDRNDIPQCEVLGTWRECADLTTALKSPALVNRLYKQHRLHKGQQNSTRWPVFLKACHLTQSSSRGTRAVTSAAELASADIADWIHEKWDFRANDFEREWQKEGNMLTQDLTPGFLLQAPMHMPVHSPAWEVQGRFSVGLEELRVEVLWGRAYMALMDGAFMFLRDGTQHDYSTWRALFKMSIGPQERTAWVSEQGYMDCVWRTAERVAKAAAIDAIRVDIFLRRGDPEGCMVNEDSLSSGLVYFGHDEYIAKIWSAPHVEYQGTNGRSGHKLLQTDTPVYDLTPAETGIDSAGPRGGSREESDTASEPEQPIGHDEMRN